MRRARELPDRPVRLLPRMDGLLMRDGAGELLKLPDEQAVRRGGHADTLELVNWMPCVADFSGPYKPPTHARVQPQQNLWLTPG